MKIKLKRQLCWVLESNNTITFERDSIHEATEDPDGYFILDQPFGLGLCVSPEDAEIYRLLPEPQPKTLVEKYFGPPKVRACYRRLLDIGEKVREGDQFWKDSVWRDAGEFEIGHRLERGHAPFRRLWGSNEHFRILEIGEVVGSDDEGLHPTRLEWTKIPAAVVGQTVDRFHWKIQRKVVLDISYPA